MTQTVLGYINGKYSFHIPFFIWVLVRLQLRLVGRLWMNVDDSLSTHFGSFGSLLLPQIPFSELCKAVVLYTVYTDLMDLQHGRAKAKVFCRMSLWRRRPGLDVGFVVGTGTGLCACTSVLFWISFHQCTILIHVSPALYNLSSWRC